MTKSNMQLTSEMGTKFWNDSCHAQNLLEAIENGAVGATSNPAIVSNIIKQEINTHLEYLNQLFESNVDSSEEEIAWKMIEKIGIDASNILKPVFEKSNAADGRVSLQINPVYYRDHEKMVLHGKKLASLTSNITIKAPCTAAGITALEEMTANGITINGTVCFTVSQAIACAEAVERGLEKAKKNGIDISKMTPCVTIMVGRLDDHLKQVAKDNDIEINPAYLEWAGVAVFKKAYQIFQERSFSSTLLAAAYRNKLHWLEFIGGKVILTIPYAWWKKFNDTEVPLVNRINNPVRPKIISELYDKFEDFRKAYDFNGMKHDDFVHFGPTIKNLHSFISSYYELLNFIREKRLV